METARLIEILEKYHNQNLVLTFTYSPNDKKFIIIYELVTGSKYIDTYQFSNIYNTFIYISTQKLNELHEGNKNG